MLTDMKRKRKETQRKRGKEHSKLSEKKEEFYGGSLDTHHIAIPASIRGELEYKLRKDGEKTWSFIETGDGKHKGCRLNKTRGEATSN